ncbi:AI-2E family transporter [Wenyingzhuangia sp. 1_MG-2023]|nr:AI-2E family transporter [Wenyingzhuangia sp. 1_MG-2023]
MKFIKLTYLQYATYILIFATLCVYAIVKCKFVLAPLTIALLISLALSSVLSKVKSVLKSNFLSVTVVTVLLIAFLTLVLMLISSQVADFYDNYPNISDKILTLLNKIEDYFEGLLGIKNIDVLQATEENKEQLISSGSSVLFSLFGNVGGLISYITFVPLYIFLILLYKEKIKDFLKRLFQPMQIKYKPVFDEVTTLVQNYLKGLFLVMLILGFANSIGLLILGVPYSFVLGFMVAFLGIIPYIGITIGSFLVLFVSFVINGSVPQLIYISILFAVIQFIEGNFITPKIIGDKINLNPLLAIIVLLIGEQLWGIVGMIVALPLAAILFIIVNNLKETTFRKPKTTATQ